MIQVDNDEYQMTDEEAKHLDYSLLNDMYCFGSEELPDSWVHTTIAMPNSFFPIFKETLQQYQALLNTKKTFPALEAMIMEAKNSLPNDINTNEN